VLLWSQVTTTPESRNVTPPAEELYIRISTGYLNANCTSLSDLLNLLTSSVTQIHTISEIKQHNKYGMQIMTI